ncbi:trehalose-phosphatase [Litoribacter alkaliphilus]|uniref:Trehalose 6-phosphate phosphatase n=1 Tax=Litoribacter ruber TaxID=702568 RepID=A0AAP2CI43_9BACT|nr:trehalose-phosphatase [Litoribacter alkaliphilus]MBS9522990.1 trehalose-phosphatase [Litoribacter alkaliphilus]
MRASKELPSAIERIDDFKKAFQEKKPLIFLDFDGTLSPIVANHEDAEISAEMKKTVQELSQKYQVAIISGRGLEDVKDKAGIADIYYAGSHGFEISGPANFHEENDEAQEVLPAFDELEPKLKSALEDLKGVRFERKKFTLAVHYRKLKEERETEFLKMVKDCLKDFPRLNMGEGKKVVEIKPNIDWHKGKAVGFLMNKLTKDSGEMLPVFLGDDLTDEDAFQELKKEGMGILVGDHGKKSHADYSLKSVDEVQEFLQKLIKF